MAAQRTPTERWAMIEKTRAYLELSWAELARMADVSESTLYNYRNGQPPSSRILSRIEAGIAAMLAASLSGAAE